MVTFCMTKTKPLCYGSLSMPSGPCFKQFNKIMLASTLDDANYAINLLQVSTTKF